MQVTHFKLRLVWGDLTTASILVWLTEFFCSRFFFFRSREVISALHYLSLFNQKWNSIKTFTVILVQLWMPLVSVSNTPIKTASEQNYCSIKLSLTCFLERETSHQLRSLLDIFFSLKKHSTHKYYLLHPIWLYLETCKHESQVIKNSHNSSLTTSWNLLSKQGQIGNPNNVKTHLRISATTIVIQH